MHRPKRLLFSSALAALLVPVSIFLVGPLSVLWPNRSAFVSKPEQIMGPFVWLAVGTLAILSVALLLLRRRPEILRRLVLIEITGSILVLVPTLIFLPDIAVLTDGNARNLAIPTTYKLVELAVLMAVPLCAFLFRSRLTKHLDTVAIVVFAWPLLSLAATAFSHPRSTGLAARPGRIAAISEVSTNFNIFHLMFDSLQGEMISELLAAHPDYAEDLQGFTHFREHMGHTNWTTQSVTMILTGQNYNLAGNAGEDGYDVLRRLLGDSIVKRLRGSGFLTKTILPGAAFEAVQSDEFAHLPQLAGELDLTRSRLRIPGFGTVDQDSVSLADLSLVRMVPSFLKDKIYNAGKWVIAPRLSPAGTTDDLTKVPWTPIETDILLSKAFFQKYTRELRPGTAKPCYSFIHLYPPHRPHFLNEDGAPVRRVLTWADNFVMTKSVQRAHYRAQSEYCLKLLVNFVRRLKELGIYDSSVIIVQSDTGMGIPPLMRIDAGLGPKMEHIEGLKEQELLYYANAALLIKPRHASGTFTISEAPTSHDQSYASILKLAEIQSTPGEERESGPTFFDIQAGDVRPRLFYAGDAVRGGRPPPHFETFTIRGSMFDRNNWTYEGYFDGPGASKRRAPGSAVDASANPTSSGPSQP